MKIPNGTKVRLAEDGRNGVIDGVTDSLWDLAGIQTAGLNTVSMSVIPFGCLLHGKTYSFSRMQLVWFSCSKKTLITAGS
jgi:hypothetical protein